MKNKSILIVDDESDLLELLQSIFERAGYTKIATASSGKEALSMFRNHQPDMIILDVMMPGIDGIYGSQRNSPNKHRSCPDAYSPWRS